jgi:hypothetical protein
LVKEPPTLAGFKKLKSLSVLDIDTLDIITELKSCVRNSAGTLTKLKLSFSESLALQARKPPPDIDPEDSDPDDEFQVVQVPPVSGGGYHDDVSGPARVFRAQEERKSQEMVLGRIFDVENYVVKKGQKKPREKEKEAKEDSESDPGQAFITAIKSVSSRLMKELNGTTDFSLAQQDILDIIESAARKYVTAEEAKKKDEKKEDKVEEQKDESKAKASSSADAEAKAEDKPEDESKPSDPGLFETKPSRTTKESQKEVTPEDINIEEPEEQLAIEGQDATTSKTPPNEPTTTTAAEPSSSSQSPAPTTSEPVPSIVGKAMSNLVAQTINFKTLTEKLGSFETQAKELNKEIQRLRNADGPFELDRISDAEKQMLGFSRSIHEIQKELSIVEAEIDDAQKQIPLVPNGDDAESHARQINDYQRSTRGHALQSLGIYLIPVKPSVLSRAVDLRVLKRITLLNVGPQAPIWAHLQKENKESPLPLRKIYTDNVSTAFLTFVSQLEELHELFLLERDHKYKPESFAPRTNTTMDQIRRLVLKKHMGKLKRLMIKNTADMSWDFDEKATLLLCRRGQNLQELACNMGIKAIVSWTLSRQLWEGIF